MQQRQFVIPISAGYCWVLLGTVRVFGVLRGAVGYWDLLGYAGRRGYRGLLQDTGGTVGYWGYLGLIVGSGGYSGVLGVLWGYCR